MIQQTLHAADFIFNFKIVFRIMWFVFGCFFVITH